MTAEPTPPVDVGEISELRGVAQVVRDVPVPANLAFGIQSLDRLETAAGRMAVEFLDDSVVRLTENSRLVVDEYVYDPNPSKGKMALNFASGTARFITGSRIDKKRLILRTPSADLSIRGTDFSVTVDPDMGRSLIVLLPDEFGNSSGEIAVTTAIGTVILNKPFEATTVRVFESRPSKPVILDITLQMLDNLLLVNPPEPVEDSVEENTESSGADFLDFNDLDVDFLAEDMLAEDSDFEFTELDIDYLSTDFLTDLLSILDALDTEDEKDALEQLATSIGIAGTEVGQDRVTQIVTIIDGQNVSLRRNVQHNTRIDLNGTNAYTVILVQDGVSHTVKINGGTGSTIRISQGS